MKRVVVLLLGILLLGASCDVAPSQDLQRVEPAPTLPAVALEQEVAGLEPDTKSYVEDLADQHAHTLGLTAREGEPAIRAAYRDLVSRVYLADPVGLDMWRYLSGEEQPIPYLENRALSPLLFDIGSCEDFAAALVLVLRAQGFEAEYVAGYTLSVHQVYVDHAWAIVRLDGKWYHLDPQLEQNVTRSNTLTFRYYLRSDEELEVDHKWGENLIDYWSDMPEQEKVVIRREYTPPACPGSYPRPEPETLPLPPRPNMADVETRISAIIAQSGKGKQHPISLHVEPPVLVQSRHVTPRLLPEQMEPVPEQYRRGLLKGDQAGFYDKLRSAAERYPDIAAVAIPASMNNNQVQFVVDAFFADNPASYWLRTTLPEAVVARNLTLTASDSPEVVARDRDHIEEVAVSLLQGAKGMSDFEKARYIHDYLAGNVRYDKETTRRNSGNIYGALVEGVAHCNGYAGAFQYLAGRVGLEAAYLTGTSTRGVAHAWNAVRLEGEWLYVDVTWDRPLKPVDGVYHDYFLIRPEEMRLDRHPGDESLLPPEPSPDVNGYYQRMGYMVGGESVDPTGDLAAVFLRQLKEYETFPTEYAPVFLELKVMGDTGDYLRWKEQYIKQVFAVLRAMEAQAREEGLPFTLSVDESVACDFNDTMQVLTFYPRVKILGR